MARTKSPHSQYTPLPFLYLLLLLLIPPTILSIPNITSLLSPYPDLSSFSSLLSSTSLPTDLLRRSSLTLLAVPNSLLPPSKPSPTSLADTLRYHVLLQYLSPSDLLHFPPSGKLITTLFQTTGRATDNLGSVNITQNPSTKSITIHSPYSNTTILSLVKSIPYNLTIFTVSSLLIPYPLDLLSSSQSAPHIALNITKALLDGHNFNVAASLLQASGVVDEFQADENGAGITLFIPTDDSFSDLPVKIRFQSLPANNKAVILKFHVLHSYYPLGSLESIVNPVQPTLATEDMGAGSFTLNISRVNGSVAINSGIVQASVTQTVFDQKPVAIFGVSKVLLPKEIFGDNPMSSSMESSALPPGFSIAPESAVGGSASPPGFQKEMRSEAVGTEKRCVVCSCCIVLLYVLFILH